MSQLTEFENLIRENRFQEVFDRLDTLNLKAKDKQKLLTLISRYNQFKSNQLNGTSSDVSELTEFNKIRANLLQLIHDSFAVPNHIVSSNARTEPKQSSFNLSSIIVLTIVTIVGVSVLLWYINNTINSLEGNPIDGHSLTQVDQQTANFFQTTIEFEQPSSSLNGKLLLNARPFHSHAKVEFTGAYAVSNALETLHPDHIKEIKMMKGKRYYVQLSEKSGNTWGINCLDIGDTNITLEFFILEE